RNDLFDLFRSTGLTSAFLNDARKIHVGALARAEAEALLRERLAEADRVRVAYELGGGFPAALGGLAPRRAGGRGASWRGGRAVRGGGLRRSSGCGGGIWIP